MWKPTDSIPLQIIFSSQHIQRMLWTLLLSSFSPCISVCVLPLCVPRYVLVSHIQQRTMCCLLSAYLFKVRLSLPLLHCIMKDQTKNFIAYMHLSLDYVFVFCLSLCTWVCIQMCVCVQCVLCSSQPHPQRDLLYGSYSVGEQLLPGVDLFSDPIRVHPPTTVASLHFLCHWLYSTRHYVTVNTHPHTLWKQLHYGTFRAQPRYHSPGMSLWFLVDNILILSLVVVMSCDSIVGLRSRQLKEALFMKKVRGDVTEERANRLRWW